MPRKQKCTRCGVEKYPHEYRMMKCGRLRSICRECDAAHRRASHVRGLVKCQHCGVQKERSEFTRNAAGVLRAHRCKDCLNLPRRRQRKDFDQNLPDGAPVWRGPEPMGIAPHDDEYTRHKLAYPYKRR